MYNSNSLLTGIRKLTSHINLIDKTRITSPMLGFIDSEITYLNESISIKEIMLESVYKKVLPKLRELINKIPEGKQAVDPVSQSHAMNEVMCYKAYTKDGFPYTLLVSVDQEKFNELNEIYFKIIIIVAYANIKTVDKF